MLFFFGSFFNGNHEYFFSNKIIFLFHLKLKLKHLTGRIFVTFVSAEFPCYFNLPDDLDALQKRHFVSGTFLMAGSELFVTRKSHFLW